MTVDRRQDPSGEGAPPAQEEETAPSSNELIAAPVGGRGRRWGGGGEGPGGPARRGRDRDLTTGSVSRNLWYLAWPQMVEGVLNSLDHIADIFWAGVAVGFRGIAGLGVAQAYTQLMQMGRMGLDTSMQAMVSRAVGAQRVDLANHVALQAFTLTIAFSLTMAVVGIFLSEFLMGVVGVSQAVIDETLLYLQIQFVGAATQGFRQMTAASLQSSGDALTPMIATMIARAIHLILTPFLVFGWAGLPDMGIAGAAVANVIAHGLGMLLNFHALFTGKSRLHLTLRGYYPDFPVLWRLVRIGAPASVTGIERTISELVLVWLVTPFGDAALAAYSLTRRLERLTSMGSMGLGRASGILVGQNLGAGLPERAKSTVRWALLHVTAIRGTFGVILIIFPVFFVSLFDSTPEFVVIAALWLRIQGVGGLFMGGGMVFQQSFNVAGDTLAPMIVTLMSLWVLEIPMAIILTLFTPLGMYGIPIAMASAMIARVLLYLVYFANGRWLRVRVLEETAT